MKTNFFTLTAILGAAITFTACENNDNGNNAPTAAEFKSMETSATNSLKQHFTFDAAAGLSTTSLRNVSINILPNSLTKNGVAVTGSVDLEFIEIFDGGNMAVTGRPTMGNDGNGNLKMLVSGGEFYVNATQNGESLDQDNAVQLFVPAQNTGEFNPDMTLWKGVVTDTIQNRETSVWDNTGTAIGIQGESYYSGTINFGWANVDCFSTDPRPKTTILARPPSGYNFENSSVYLSYDGQGNSLARLDRFTAGLFSEHYGQIPIGLHCHAIFMTVENGNYRYAIKAAVIVDGGTITFTKAETTIGTKDQLIAAINAVQN